MQKRAFILLAALVGLSASATAQDFNVDVLNIYGNPSNAYGAAAAQTGFWQNIDAGVSTFPFPLANTSGAPTAVTASYTSGFNFAFDNAATTGDDQALLDDAQCGFGAPVWTFAGLAAGTYHVYSYAWAPDVPTSYITNVTVSGGSAGTQACGGAGWTGSHVDGVTYVDDVVTVAAGGSITINFAVASGFITINGFQLDQQGAAPPVVNDCQILPTVSQGCNSTVAFSGAPSATSASPFTITFGSLNTNVNGVVFYGINGPNNAVWSAQSFLCVKPPTQRLGGIAGASGSTGGAGGCGGQYSFNMNAIIQGSGLLGTPMGSGQAVDIQGWQRDAASAKTTNLTDSLSFVVGP